MAKLPYVDETFEVVEEPSVPVYDNYMDELLPIKNIVEVLNRVFGSFEGAFEGTDIRVDWRGTNLYVKMANGQIARVNVGTLTQEEAEQYRNGEAS